MYEAQYLKAALVKEGMTQEKAAKALNLSPPTFNKKLNGKKEFTVSEVELLYRLLPSMTKEDVMHIFFAGIVA